MDTREIKREARDLHRALLPLLEMDQDFEGYILNDLAKVVQVCGRHNNNLSSNELLSFLTVYALELIYKVILKQLTV